MTEVDKVQSRATFTFEGRRMHGTVGETIARALHANGVPTLSYSVKYHRPRGVMCARGRCVACLVEVDGKPGVKACTTPLADGMDIRRQDFRPFYAPLLTAAVRHLPFPAGFYFRFFSRPRWVRRAFLATLRQMAGVARVDHKTRHTPMASGWAGPARAAYDVVVCGGGVSGMASAIAAAASGAEVLVVDEYPTLGGHSMGRLRDPALAARRDELIEAVAASRSITVSQSTAVHGLYTDNTILMGPSAGYGSLRRLRAHRGIFATGTSDAIPLFENNDLPGIFGSHAIRVLLERDGFAPGRRAIVYGTAPEVIEAVDLLTHHGIAVAVVASPGKGDIPQSMAPIEEASLVAVGGRRWVAAATFERAGERVTVDGDMLIVAVPGQPSYELPYQVGFRYQLDAAGGDFAVMRPRKTTSGAWSLTGGAAGLGDWREKIAHAERVGGTTP